MCLKGLELAVFSHQTVHAPFVLNRCFISYESIYLADHLVRDSLRARWPTEILKALTIPKLRNLCHLARLLLLILRLV